MHIEESNDCCKLTHNNLSIILFKQYDISLIDEILTFNYSISHSVLNIIPGEYYYMVKYTEDIYTFIITIFVAESFFTILRMACNKRLMLYPRN